MGEIRRSRTWSSSSLQHHRVDDAGLKFSCSAPVLVGGSAGTSFFAGLWSSGRLPSGAKDVRVISRRPERFSADSLKELKIVEVESVKVWDALKEAAWFGLAVGASIASFALHYSYIDAKTLAIPRAAARLVMCNVLIVLLLFMRRTRWKWKFRNVEYKYGALKSRSYDDAADAINGCDSVWISTPVNAYPSIFEKIIPLVAAEAKRTRSTIPVFVLYGQSGADWMALRAAGGQLPDGVALVVFKNFPAVLRRSDTMVTNQGFHPECGWFSVVPDSAGDAAAECIGHLIPEAAATKKGRWSSHVWGGIVKMPNPLVCTLSGSNQLLHPSVIAGAIGYAPGRTFAYAPKVYRWNKWETWAIMGRLWRENLQLSAVVESALGLDGLKSVLGNTLEVRVLINDFKGESWPLLGRKLMLWIAINFSSRLSEARFPMVKCDPPMEHRLRLDTTSRFITDDVAYGLCVLVGLGEILDFPMPHTAALIGRLQPFLGKEFVVVERGAWRLRGRDVPETGAPQAYGVTDLKQLKDMCLRGRLPSANQ